MRAVTALDHPADVSRLTRRHRTGRTPRKAGPVATDLEQLIALVRENDHTHVQRFFNALVSQRIDDELEAMAAWVLGEWDPDVDTDRVRALMGAGQYRTATNAVIMVMRREVANELRTHKRSEADKFLDSCVVE